MDALLATGRIFYAGRHWPGGSRLGCVLSSDGFAYETTQILSAQRPGLQVVFFLCQGAPPVSRFAKTDAGFEFAGNKHQSALCTLSRHVCFTITEHYDYDIFFFCPSRPALRSWRWFVSFDHFSLYLAHDFGRPASVSSLGRK